MRNAVPVLAALFALTSVTAKGECRLGPLQDPSQLTEKALALRSALFMFLCEKSVSQFVDANDVTLKERIVRPDITNKDKLRIYDFYPADARNRGVEGRSVHLVVVELDGKISQYALIDSSGSELLDRAALTFLSAIRLSPGTLDGAPTRMTMIMPVAFTLPGSRK